MLGYQFILNYDASVLTATGYGSYSPFDHAWPSKISDAEGYVAVAYSMPSPEYIGFETTVPVPILRIDFAVDAKGSSLLDLHSTVFSDIYGEMIPHYVVDGFFANIHVQTPNIAVTSVTSETYLETSNGTSPGINSTPRLPTSNVIEPQSSSSTYHVGVELTETYTAKGISGDSHIYKNYVCPQPHWVVFHLALRRLNDTHMEWLEVGTWQNRTELYGDFKLQLFAAWGILKNGETEPRPFEKNVSNTVPLTDHSLEIIETNTETFQARINSNLMMTHTFSIHDKRYYTAAGESTNRTNSLRGHFWDLKYYGSDGVSHFWQQVEFYQDYPPYVVGSSLWSATVNYFYTMGGGVWGDINGNGEVELYDVGELNAYFYDVFETPDGHRIEIFGPAGRYDSNADVYPELVPDERVNIFEAAVINANWGKKAG